MRQPWEIWPCLNIACRRCGAGPKERCINMGLIHRRLERNFAPHLDRKKDWSEMKHYERTLAGEDRLTQEDFWSDAAALMRDEVRRCDEEPAWDPCRRRIAQEYANAFQLYALGLGSPYTRIGKQKAREDG